MDMQALIIGHAPREQMPARLADLSIRPDLECLYFGCIGRAGHYCWSMTAFFAPGTLTFAQMVRLSRTRWPQVWARFKFDVVQVDKSGRPVT